MNSIKIKMIMLYLVLVIVVIITMGTFILVRLNNNETNKSYKQLNKYSKKIEKEIVNYHKKETSFQEGLNRLFLSNGDASFRNIQILILDGKGLEVIAKTDFIENYVSPVIISAINKEVAYKSWRKAEDTTGAVKNWFEIGFPVYSETMEKDYIIYIREDATLSAELLANTSYSLIIALAVSIFLGGIIGSLFSNTVTEPIINLTNSTKAFSKGMLNSYVKVYSNDEIGQLAKTFNEMSKNLNMLIYNLNLEKSKIEIILNNMTDGILAYDTKGKLIHGNMASNNLIGYKNLQIINIEGMFKIIKEPYENLTKNYNLTKEKNEEINGKNLNIKLNTYTNNLGKYEGVIIVLQDITKSVKLDNMRKEFVANVSHELRTPLTTIMTYSETLKDIVDTENETAISFLDVMITEADRMTFLVKDLLDLSSFDNNKIVLNITKENLIRLIDDSIKQSEILIENKEKKIHFESKGKYYINCDKSRLNQVIVNILTNAIKYSGDGKNIYIDLEESKENNEYITLKIRDEGLGISEDDLSRVFERFYRVDKARSKLVGGTGLGLSISKQIVKAHNGTINIQSEVGVGTVVVIKLKKI